MNKYGPVRAVAIRLPFRRGFVMEEEGHLNAIAWRRHKVAAAAAAAGAASLEPCNCLARPPNRRAGWWLC